MAAALVPHGVGDPLKSHWRRIRKGSITCAAFDRTGTFLALGTAAGAVRVLDTFALKADVGVLDLDPLLREFTGPKASHSIDSISWSPNSSLLAVAVRAGLLLVLHVRTGDALAVYRIAGTHFSAVEWHPNAPLCCCIARGRAPLLLDLQQRSAVQLGCCAGEDAPPRALAVDAAAVPMTISGVSHASGLDHWCCFLEYTPHPAEESVEGSDSREGGDSREDGIGGVRGDDDDVRGNGERKAGEDAPAAPATPTAPADGYELVVYNNRGHVTVVEPRSGAAARRAKVASSMRPCVCASAQGGFVGVTSAQGVILLDLHSLTIAQRLRDPVNPLPFSFCATNHDGTHVVACPGKRGTSEVDSLFSWRLDQVSSMRKASLGDPEGVLSCLYHPRRESIVAVTEAGTAWVIEDGFRSEWPGAMFPHGFRVIYDNAEYEEKEDEFDVTEPEEEARQLCEETRRLSELRLDVVATDPALPATAPAPPAAGSREETRPAASDSALSEELCCGGPPLGCLLPVLVPPTQAPDAGPFLRGVWRPVVPVGEVDEDVEDGMEDDEDGDGEAAEVQDDVMTQRRARDARALAALLERSHDPLELSPLLRAPQAVPKVAEISWVAKKRAAAKRPRRRVEGGVAEVGGARRRSRH